MAAKKNIYRLVCHCGSANAALKIFVNFIYLITYVGFYSNNNIKCIGILFAVTTGTYDFSK